MAQVFGALRNLANRRRAHSVSKNAVCTCGGRSRSQSTASTLSSMSGLSVVAVDTRDSSYHQQDLGDGRLRSRSSSDSLSSAVMKIVDTNKFAPPVPMGDLEDPILLPNELVLQRFNAKRSMFKLSQYKVQQGQARLGCAKCSSADNKHNLITEASREHVAGDSTMGTLFVTTERLVFSPKAANYPGYTLSVADITALTMVECTDYHGKTTKWCCLCYINDFVASVPFSQKARCAAFLKLVSNIRFEHTVKKFLPPVYPGAADGSEGPAWDEDDCRLPSYSDSEQALTLYMQQQGVRPDVLDAAMSARQNPATGTVPATLNMVDYMSAPSRSQTEVVTGPSSFVWF